MSSTNSPPERSVDASHNPPGLPGVIPSETLDTDNPWPGLAAFREADQDFFYGREQETVGLLRLVRREWSTEIGPVDLMCTSAEGEWVAVEQGFEMGRPSRIDVRVSGERVEVAGRCVIIVEGKLTV